MNSSAHICQDSPRATLEEEDELEEGEAVSLYVDDDRNINPDVTLSYMDEKVQNLLGHFQKDFEGGVYVQALGPKYGAYGSFLPSQERSPSSLSQPIASPKVQSQSRVRSSCNLPVDGGSQNPFAASNGPVVQKSGATPATRLHGPHNLKSLPGEDLERPNSSQIAEKASERDGPPFMKSENPPDQRKLKVRIKVIPDKGLSRNASIYSGLGITSPSSSTGNSPEEGRVALLSLQGISNESTSSILKILTSCPASCDSLNSPLRNNLLNLIRSRKELVDCKPGAFFKERSGYIVKSHDNSESVLEVKAVLAGKKFRSIQMNGNDLQARLENELHSVGRKSSDSEPHNSISCLPQLHVGIDRSFGSVGKAPEVVRQLEHHMPVKKRGLKDKFNERLFACEFVKDKTLGMMAVQGTTNHQESRSNSVESSGKEGLKTFEKESSFDLGEDVTVNGKKISSSLSAKREDKIVNLEVRNIKPNKPLKVASQSHDKSVKLTAKSFVSKEVSSGGNSKLKHSQINGSTTFESDGTLRSEVNVSAKDIKSASRNAKKVHHIHTKLEHISVQENLPEKHHKSKDLNLEDTSGKWDNEEKSSQKYGSGKSGNKVGSVFSQGDSLAEDAPPINGLISRTEPAPEFSSVVITEDWVECVCCQTWRLLPPSISASQLPDKWRCSMQNWLPEMKSCDFSEDETTQALRALYHVPVHETQNTLITDANAPEAQLNVATQHHMGLGKKFQSKDTPHGSNSGGPLVNTQLMKNHQQDVMKSTALKNVNQPSSEVNLFRKSNVKLLKRPAKVIEKCPDNLEENGHEKHRKKIKRERYSDNYDQGVTIKVETEGHDNPKTKLKRERNSDYHHQGVAKKVKLEGPMGMDNLYSSENTGKPRKIQVSSTTSFPKIATPKEKRHDNKEKLKLQISVKSERYTLPDSMDGGLLDVNSHEATRSSTKTRKLVKNRDQLRDTKISVKENCGDSGCRSEKKSNSLESELRGFRKTRVGDTQTTMPSSRTSIADKSAKKSQQFKEKLALGVTVEDITALRRDLGSEQLSTAATSSSSKVSDSGGNRVNYQEVKGSPVESVSSSPMRSANLRELSPTRNLKFGEFPAELGQKILPYNDDAFESNQFGTSMKEKVGNPSLEILVPEAQGTDSKRKDTIALSVRAGRHMVNTDVQTMKRSRLSHTDVRDVPRHTSKIKMSLNPDPSQRQKSGLDFAACSKERNKASGSNFEIVADTVPSPLSEKEALKWKQSAGDETQIDQSHQASRHKLLDDSDSLFSDESTIKALTKDNNVLKRNSGSGMESENFGDIKCQSQPKFGECGKKKGTKNVVGSVHLRTNKVAPFIQNPEVETGMEIIPTDVGMRSKKLKVLDNDDKGSLPLHCCKLGAEIQIGTVLDPSPLNTSKDSEGLQIVESAPNFVLENSNHGSMNHHGSSQSGHQSFNGQIHSKEDTTIQSASAALAKAEEYKHFGDFSKESGFECNEAYFKSALMYLLGAALVESSNSESQKGEKNQIQISLSSAKLCETCALEYEKRQEMAAAALAYKCMEVSYMRIVYFKSLCTRRVWHDLQSNLQRVSQSESPSSSVSDIDNSNYQIINKKVMLWKGNSSAIRNHVIAPRDHQNFIRLLDFTMDVNSAMEAARKSQSAFAAASKMMAGRAQNNSIITLVKEALDFGFQDLEAFVCMVQHAIVAISRLGFSGG